MKKKDIDLKDRLLDLDKLKFEIKDTMRYDDVGDYYGNTIVSYDMKDPIVNNAILIHEFIEYTLIRSAGLSSELIDLFDNDDDAPYDYPEEYELYSKFHRMANKIERQFIENLGLNWKEHGKKVYTTPIKVAITNISKELHKHEPSQEKIENYKEIVEEGFEEKK